MLDSCSITSTEISYHKGSFGQSTPVDGKQVLVGELSTAEDDLHKELIIHQLEP